jgi:rare lipoprotein A
MEMRKPIYFQHLTIDNHKIILIIMKNAIMVLSVLIVLSGCASAPVQSPPKWIGYKESGKASFYNKKYHSQKTASGERYDHNANTAAHRKIPFGTNVKVTNVKNGKSVVVKINDRGPFVKGRIIDLSGAAFSSIGKMKSGVIQVNIEIIE